MRQHQQRSRHNESGIQSNVNNGVDYAIAGSSFMSNNFNYSPPFVSQGQSSQTSRPLVNSSSHSMIFNPVAHGPNVPSANTNGLLMQQHSTTSSSHVYQPSSIDSTHYHQQHHSQNSPNECDVAINSVNYVSVADNNASVCKFIKIKCIN